MKKFTLVTLISFSLITSASIFATPKPSKCPSAAALQNVKFELTESTTGDEKGTWAVGVLHNRYDTNDTWTFVIDGLKAKDSEDALRIGNAAVKNISFENGPVDNHGGMWVCFYNTKEGYTAFTYTPPFEGLKK